MHASQRDVILDIDVQIIGGLHLAQPNMVSRIPPTVDFLSRQLKPAPTFVLPLHCSGFQAKIALEKALGQGCVPAGVGTTIEVRGDADGEQHMFAPCVS
jgi:7,8-dihydropterin-6-yl-methyl-4-(beta-D-ribofuranosyl)aminobenzene 5'-phosphate synthase